MKEAAPPDIRPGQSLDLLKELHILTRDGKLNQDSRRKLKQVYHLYQFIEKLLLEVPPHDDGPTLADHGAGKSYLGFILYDLFFKARGSGHIYGIETRRELVERSRALAQRLGFDRMSFLDISAADAIEASPYAANTLVLVTYDEGGGYFDHVAPPPTSSVDGKDYGPRVPTFAIGRFARRGYVSHVELEHSSIVKFIEWNWLGGETGQLGTRDAVVNNIGSLLDPDETGAPVPQ